MLTVLEIIKRSTEFLQKHGVESPRLNAELLVGHALGLKRMQLYLQFERPLAETELAKIRPLVKRRSEREPLQYIVGTTEFGGLTLKVDRRALIPRPETELLVEIAKEKCAPPPARVLDLGTGSGALALALAKLFPEARVTAVDVSPDALALARENAAALGLAERVAFMPSDWFAALPADDRFELIVANPPYLTDAETRETTPEVQKFEPWNALSSGPAGTEALAVIVREARTRLAPGGWLICETGIAQHAQLLDWMRTAGYASVESRKDLTGRDRFVLAGV
ncbi:peptide chain release factor N(5)-glutamine methyltransferase [Oleiharenicola sp. Vm1]|uniref:peptide chain release factor N(5)-glutamine methyltransferase n=1 Tax=Oleiharenicola sp. Vm1 TaxID=3398393 RepID=UPI0039F63DE3